jgi:hypothetical protein
MKTFIAFAFCISSFVLLAIVSPGAVASIESAMSSSSVIAKVESMRAEPAAAMVKAIDSTNDEVVPNWLQMLSLLVASASAIAAVTPSPKDDGVLSIVRKIVDLLALNFWGAKNASANIDSNKLL